MNSEYESMWVCGFTGRREQAFIDHLHITMCEACGQSLYSFILVKSHKQSSSLEVEHFIQRYQNVSQVTPGSVAGPGFTSNPQRPSLCSFYNVECSQSQTNLGTFLHSECSIYLCALPFRFSTNKQTNKHFKVSMQIKWNHVVRSIY